MMMNLQRGRDSDQEQGLERKNARFRISQNRGNLYNVIANIIIVASLASVSSVHAATFYVATTGNDTNPGTQSQPWRTIQKSLASAVAGDTVLVSGGVYKEKLNFTRGGTATQKITFKSVTGQTPIVDGQGLSIPQWDTLVSFRDVGHVRLEGFEIRNSGFYLMHIGGESHHLEIVNLDVHHGSASGIWIDGSNSKPAFSVISGCRVHNNGQGGITIWSGNAGYYRIENNQVYANKGGGNYDGIQIGGGGGGTHHVVVKGNTIHDNGAANTGEDNLDLGGHGLNHHYLVEGNDIYGSIGSFKLHNGTIKDGQYTARISSYHIARFNRFTGLGYVVYGFPTPIVVYNNTFVNPGQAWMAYNEDATLNKNVGDSTFNGGDTGRMNWKNNVFWQEEPSGGYMLLTAGQGSIDLRYSSVRFQNNLYKFSATQKLAWAKGLIVGAPVDDAAFAQYKNSNPPDLPDTGSIRTTGTVAQAFVNYSTRDYRPAQGSPAVDKGATLTKAINAGTNSTMLAVDRASYFHDGYCVNGECLNAPDSIVIGNNAAVRIVSINDTSNTITLATPQTWANGTGVSLPYKGTAPDIGAFELGATSPVSSLPSPPTNLRIQ